MSLWLLLIYCYTMATYFGVNGQKGGWHNPESGECIVVWPGPAIGKKCIFPFTWQGKTYNSCAKVQSRFKWCSTKVDSDGVHVAGQREWGKCGKGCFQTNPGPGSCKCPKPGVEGGYMEYSQAKEQFDELWSNGTVMIAEVQENKMAIGTKCPKEKCEEIETNTTRIEETLEQLKNVNMTTLEEKMTTLMEMMANLTIQVAANTATLSTKCDAAKCGTLETQINNLETPPVFNCAYTSGEVNVTTNILAPYTCDINEGSVVDTTSGKLNVTKAGKYRLTFMALNIPLNKKKVICILVKTSSNGVETKVARAVAQTKIGDLEEQVTTTIDVIHELQVGETVHVNIVVKNGAKIIGVSTEPQQVTFTGEFIRA